jgi:Lysyl oxidase
MRRSGFLVPAVLVSVLLVACEPAPTDRAPDLRMARLADISIEGTPDGRRLLRFSTVIVNVGAGAFEVHGSRSSTGATTMSVRQRVFDDAGGARDVGTAATMYYSGDGHNHWHVRDLQTYTLARLDNGRSVGTGAKHGFCFWDNVPFRLSLPGAPQSPVYRGCGVGSDLTVVTGQSIGWGDRYAATLVDQYIDVTGLGSGQYRLTAEADVPDWFLESDDGNNATWVDLALKRDRVTVHAYGPSA